jgi:hypothetical protein
VRRSQYGLGLSPTGVSGAVPVVQGLPRRKRGAAAELGLPRGAKVSGSSEESETLRALYRLRFDPHVLTEQLIDAIEDQDVVRTDLAAIPPIGVREIEALTQAPGESIASPTELMEKLLATGKREQFGAVAQSREYLLLDATWQARRDLWDSPRRQSPSYVVASVHRWERERAGFGSVVPRWSRPANPNETHSNQTNLAGRPKERDHSRAGSDRPAGR